MDDKAVVVMRPSYYQPSKTELEEDVNVDVTPEDWRAALMRNVKLKKSDDANPH